MNAVNERVGNITISEGDVIVNHMNIKDSGFSFNGKKILIVGKRSSGKSYLVDRILRTLTIPENKDNFIIVCPTEKMHPSYTKVYTNATIDYDFDDYIIFPKI